MVEEYDQSARVLNRHFGLAVRKLRESFGWSQEQLAEKADLNRSYLGEIERGAASPSLKTISKLAIALEMPASMLISHCEE